METKKLKAVILDVLSNDWAIMAEEHTVLDVASDVFGFAYRMKSKYDVEVVKLRGLDRY